jgi:hypothetical protein
VRPWHSRFVHQVRLLYNPFQMATIFTPIMVCTQGLLYATPNFLADLALLCRMLAVFPYSQTPRLKFFAIFTPVICFKIIRVVSLLESTMLSLWGMAQADSFSWTSTNRAWVLVYTVCAAVDNGCVQALARWPSAHEVSSYTSVLFLWKLRSATGNRRTLGLCSDSASSVLCGPLRQLICSQTQSATASAACSGLPLAALSFLVRRPPA